MNTNFGLNEHFVCTLIKFVTTAKRSSSSAFLGLDVARQLSIALRQLVCVHTYKLLVPLHSRPIKASQTYFSSASLINETLQLLTTNLCLVTRITYSRPSCHLIPADLGTGSDVAGSKSTDSVCQGASPRRRELDSELTANLSHPI